MEAAANTQPTTTASVASFALRSHCDGLIYHPRMPHLLAVATSNLTGKIWDGQILLLNLTNKYTASKVTTFDTRI